MPSARVSHLSSPYASFIDCVIFPLWVIYGLVSCLCTLSHLTVTCVPLRSLQSNTAKQRLTAAPTAWLSLKSSTTEADLFLSRNNSGLSRTSRGQRVKSWFYLVSGTCRDLILFALNSSWWTMSKYEDVIDTRSNIDTVRKLAYLHSFFLYVFIYFFSAALDFVYT